MSETARDEVLGALRDSGDEVLAAMLSVPPGALDNGTYENGWNVHEVMAHVASMEFAYRRLPDLARRGDDAAAAGAGGVDFNAYNARQVLRRAGRAPAELAQEFIQGRAQLLIETGRLDPVLLQAHVRSAGGSSGTLAEVIVAVAAGHARQHAEDFVRAAGAQSAASARVRAAISLGAEEAAQRCEAADAEQWLTRVTGDDWCAAGVAGHVVEILPYWATRIAEGARNSALVIGRDIEAPERLGAVALGESLSPQEAGARIRAAAGEALVVLDGLRPDEWSAPVQSTRFGTHPAVEIMRLLVAGHVRDHAAQIATALSASARA